MAVSDEGLTTLMMARKTEQTKRLIEAIEQKTDIQSFVNKGGDYRGEFKSRYEQLQRILNRGKR